MYVHNINNIINHNNIKHVISNNYNIKYKCILYYVGDRFVSIHI